jgi:hypothetical protein
MSRRYLTGALIVAVATLFIGCSSLRAFQVATMADLDAQREDVQGEIDNAVENVNKAFDQMHDRIVDGIAAGEEADTYMPAASDVEVGAVDHTAPKDSTLQGILDALLNFLLYGGGGATLATVASRARRGVGIVSGKKKPASRKA